MIFLSRLGIAALFLVATVAAFAQSSSIQIETPWARETPAGAKTGAAYMTIDNKSNVPDRLIGASSDVAKTLQIHEMAVVDGTMKMRELPGGLSVPAGGSVVLKPGSYHVMLIGLNKPLKPGDSIPLTLAFEKAGNVSIKVAVQSLGAMPHGDVPGMNHMDMK